MIAPKALEKIRRRVDKLRDWRYEVIAQVPLVMAATLEHYRTPPENLDYQPAPVGTEWGRDASTTWFRGSVETPKSAKGQRVYYRNQSYAEKMLFVNDKPWSGLNIKHHEALLTANAKGGETWNVHVEAYTGHKIPGNDPYQEGTFNHQFCGYPGHEPPHTLEASELLIERVETTAFFYEADTLYRTALILDEHCRRRAVIVDVLSAAFDAIPMHWEDTAELEAAVAEARKQILPLLDAKNGDSMPTVSIVGHAHIDIAWLWPVRESIRKGARSFSTVLGLMHDYPELRFQQSQPWLYAEMEEHYPDILRRIQKRVKEGRWEPNGGMWVEADCNVTGGESLVRQFLEGRKATQQYFGYSGDTLWLPDVFGYSAALPQILQGCGIKHFVTSKINWNDTNVFPHDTFWWEGIDGSRIFAHYILTRDGGYNAEVLPNILNDTWQHVQHKELLDTTLASVGFGDGGGGPTREMVEHARRMTDLEGCPKTEWVNVSDFLKELQQKREDWPDWVGELYLEIHRGTYTTQAKTKRYNRKLEQLLREVELYAVMAQPLGFDYPAAALQGHWRTLLTNQFHDIIPGSSIHTVYETAEAEYFAMEASLLTLRTEALQCMGATYLPDAEHNAWLVANALSWSREDLVYLENAKGACACDIEGKALPCQKTEQGLAVLVNTEALSTTPIALRDKEETWESPFTFNGKSLETPHYTLHFNNEGAISACVDKAAKRNIVRDGEVLNQLYTAEDFPMFWDAWDIDRFYRSTIQPVAHWTAREVVEDGPLFFTLRTEYKVGKASTLRQDMTCYVHSRRIDFKTHVDWHERHTLLKAGFAFDILADHWRNEIQFGHVERPMHANTSWDEARFEVCAHKWVDVSEGNYGVALLNDCKYGHDSLDKQVSMTLLRSPMNPDEEADQGEHEFIYALLPHDGTFSTEAVVREAYALNQPLTPAFLGETTGEGQGIDFCSVDNPNIIMETIKRAEKDDATILRCYEAGKTRGAATFTFARTIKKAASCDMMEENDAALKTDKNSVTVDFRPFEIKTLKVYLK